MAARHVLDRARTGTRLGSEAAVQCRFETVRGRGPATRVIGRASGDVRERLHRSQFGRKRAASASDGVISAASVASSVAIGPARPEASTARTPTKTDSGAEDRARPRRRGIRRPYRGASGSAPGSRADFRRRRGFEGPPRSRRRELRSARGCPRGCPPPEPRIESAPRAAGCAARSGFREGPEQPGRAQLTNATVGSEKLRGSPVSFAS